MVFDYEAKVRFRNEERDKYRKMLHAEYAKLSQVLNEGIVKFNQKVRLVKFFFLILSCYVLDVLVHCDAGSKPVESFLRN